MPSLGLPGAESVHLPEDTVQTYQGLVDLLHEHRCTAFVAYPNVPSFHFWSGIDPPVPYPPGAWVVIFDEEWQRKTVESMRESPRPCAIRNHELVEEWVRGDPAREGPLRDYLLEELEPVAEIDHYEFLLPPEAAED
jgi:hypothetical protein